MTLEEVIKLDSDVRELRAKVRAARDGRCRLAADIEHKKVGDVTLLSGALYGFEYEFIESDWQ